MTDQLDTDDPSRPRVRFAPDVRRQIDAARFTDGRGFEISPEDAPSPISGHINDQIARLARSQPEMEALALAAGYELEPPEFETEHGPNVYRMTVTRRLRPRQEQQVRKARE